MSKALLDRFNKHLVPSEQMASMTEAPPGNHWVVVGDFTRVNQGSRALRSLVGFGAGGTKIETSVKVYHMYDTTVPFLTFHTTGGSGAQPGGLATQSALTAVAGAAKGLTEDAVRTSRMITAELSDYMYQKGWIPKDKALKPKR